MPGPYGPLFEFLTTRFADRVVLTLKEIEDVLGFALPPAARTEAAWWTTSDSVANEHAGSWTRANRTATPNMRAMTVLFERSAFSRVR
jgi:hypothetical protein